MDKTKLIPLLMLPGMMCDYRIFAPQLAYFSGNTEALVGDIGQADNITIIAQQVLAKAPPQFALMGLSMGGIVAMEMLRQAPQRIKGVAFLDTNPLAEQADVQAMRNIQIQKVQAGQLASVMVEEMKPKYLADENLTEGCLANEDLAGKHHHDKHSAILEVCMDMALGLGADVFIQQSKALQQRRDQQACLANIDVPALVLMGQQDSLCPLERHQLMATLIKDAELVIIPNSGHLPTLEQPQATNMALTKWLSRL